MKKHFIEFKTKGFPGADGKRLLGTFVIIGTEILSSLTGSVSVALPNESKYPDLQEFVFNNSSVADLEAALAKAKKERPANGR